MFENNLNKSDTTREDLKEEISSSSEIQDGTPNQDVSAEHNKNPGTSSSSEEKAEENQNKEFQELQNKLEELNDKYLRLYSEFENFRRRMQKEKSDWIKYSGEYILKQILPVLDDFERAIKYNQNLDDINAVKEGFHLIYNKLLQILKQKGLEPIECKDCVFNPDVMEAITQVPVPSENEKGKVMEQLEKGYKLHDKIIRFAKVVVGA